MAGVTLDLDNQAELKRDLKRMASAAAGTFRLGLIRLGAVVEKRSKAYSPISPKLEQIEANLIRGAIPGGGGGGGDTKLTIKRRNAFFWYDSSGTPQMIGGKARGRSVTKKDFRAGASTRISINRSTGGISIIESTLHSRRRTGKRAIKEFGKEGKGVNPGGLQRSTKVQTIKSDPNQAYVDIGVALNSEAGKYAHYIHDQGPHGTGKWKKRGLGTRAKGPKAGDKYIERAADDTVEDQIKVLADTVDRWFKAGGF